MADDELAQAGIPSHVWHPWRWLMRTRLERPGWPNSNNSKADQVQATTATMKNREGKKNTTDMTYITLLTCG